MPDRGTVGLCGKTDWCGLAMTCSRAGCGTKNSYTNDVIRTQLLWGLKTRKLPEKVLQKGDAINLDNTLVLMESTERGRSDKAKLEKAHGGSVVAVGTSHEAKPKGGSKKGAGSLKGGAKQVGGSKTSPCHCCGSTDHKGSFLERKENSSSGTTRGHGLLHLGSAPACHRHQDCRRQPGQVVGGLLCEDQWHQSTWGGGAVQAADVLYGGGGQHLPLQGVQYPAWHTGP